MKIWSCSPTPGHITGENVRLKRYMHPTVHCSTIYNSQDIQTTQTSIDRRTFRRRYSTLIHWNTAQSLKDNKITPLAGAWIDLEISLLSEISQKEKDKCHTMSVIYEIWNTKQVNLSADLQTLRTVLWLPRGNGDCRAMDWEFGISGCRLVYRE